MEQLIILVFQIHFLYVKKLLEVNYKKKKKSIMRNNLTKKDIVKSIYMQIGFPKKVMKNY